MAPHQATRLAPHQWQRAAFGPSPGPVAECRGELVELVARTIARGIKGEMPSLAKKLGPPDRARLTAYVRSLE